MAIVLLMQHMFELTRETRGFRKDEYFFSKAFFLLFIRQIRLYKK